MRFTKYSKIAKYTLLVILTCGWAAAIEAQPPRSHNWGKEIHPAFEGWERLEDGSYDLYFGYQNENWEEKPVIPVGNDNFFSPGPPDQGQPTYFHPWRNRFVFTVNVPADWGSPQEWRESELVWTVTANGETRSAYATLHPDYIVNKGLIQAETGAFGGAAGSEQSEANEWPELTVHEGTTRTTMVGEPLTLRAQVEDDGLPTERSGPETRTGKSELERIMQPPTAATVAKVNGLHLSWVVYRGDGDNVVFDPPQIKVWEDTRPSTNSPWSRFWVPPEVPSDGQYETEVTFLQPGTYVLLGRADDGGLYDDQYVTVTVEGGQGRETVRLGRAGSQ